MKGAEMGLFFLEMTAEKWLSDKSFINLLWYEISKMTY